MSAQAGGAGIHCHSNNLFVVKNLRNQLLRRCGFRRRYAKCAVGQRKIGFGGAANAAEMRNRFAFAILTFS
jgi:hypothetical protein